MPKEIDITGNKYNMLTAIKRVYGYKESGVYWLCKCDCDNECIVKKYDLVHLKQMSCGCFQKQSAREKHTKHNMKDTKLYHVWCSMRQRCLNPNNHAYNHYGGKGVTICKDWLDDFMNFYNWSMQNGYMEGLSIDRIDNDGNYEPSNCRWATREVQQNNTSKAHKITYNGVTKSPAQWARIVDVSETTIKNRLFKRNMSVEDALFMKDARFTANGSKRRKKSCAV